MIISTQSGNDICVLEAYCSITHLGNWWHVNNGVERDKEIRNYLVKNNYTFLGTANKLVPQFN